MTTQTEGPFRVYIGLVPLGYLNTDALAAAIREGLKFCRLTERLRGKIVVRPETSEFSARAAPYASTQAEFLRAAVLGMSSGNPVSQIILLAQNQAARRHLPPIDAPGLSTESIDSSPCLRYLLAKEGVLGSEDRFQPDPQTAPLLRRYWPEIVTSRHFFDADCLVYCPKIKGDVRTGGFSGALALGGMGNLFGAQLLQGQSLHNDRRIADMLEVANPDVIISDGIITPFGGNDQTQKGHELGVIIVANNAVAHDLVASHILNLDPRGIRHLQAAMARGWGPSDLGKIQLGGAGEEGIELLREKTRHWRAGLMPVSGFGDLFERENPGLVFPWTIIPGEPYEDAGIQGSFLNWLYLNYDDPTRRRLMAKWPRASVILGEANVPAERRLVFLIGDRAITHFRNLASEIRPLLCWGTRGLWRARMRSGRTHLVAYQNGNPPRSRDLNLFFLAASLGRLRNPLLKPTLLARHPRTQGRVLGAVKTSNMQRNAWWAL